MLFKWPNSTLSSYLEIKIIDRKKKRKNLPDLVLSCYHLLSMSDIKWLNYSRNTTVLWIIPCNIETEENNYKHIDQKHEQDWKSKKKPWHQWLSLLWTTINVNVLIRVSIIKIIKCTQLFSPNNQAALRIIKSNALCDNIKSNAILRILPNM